MLLKTELNEKERGSERKKKRRVNENLISILPSNDVTRYERPKNELKETSSNNNSSVCPSTTAPSYG